MQADQSGLQLQLNEMPRLGETETEITQSISGPYSFIMNTVVQPSSAQTSCDRQIKAGFTPHGA
jgi:hypothetical protein